MKARSLLKVVPFVHAKSYYLARMPSKSSAASITKPKRDVTSTPLTMGFLIRPDSAPYDENCD